MIVIGLTGSIGMGKSAAAAMLRRLRVPVHDADATVHALLGPHGAAVQAVLKAFPGIGTVQSGIDRPALGRLVFADPAALRRLEAILHPAVATAERRFLAAAARRRVPIAVRDVPLLYETGGERRCDAVIVVSAPAFLQRQRVLRRRGMSAKRLNDVLAQQLPDQEKRRRTPYIVETGLSKRHSLKMLVGFVRVIRLRHGSGTAYRNARNHPRYRNNRP
jgi:dephospho-CoA kinase